MSKNIIPVNEISFNSTSFMDPVGRVFEWKNEIYRSIFSGRLQFITEFLESQTFDSLFADGKVIDTNVTDYIVEGFEAVLKHRKVEFVSYCFEWPPEMLKRAAQLTIELCIELLQENATIQDAYPWNILFEGTKPVMVDFSSIVPVNNAFIWIPYQQFCDFFYSPLLLSSAGHVEVAHSLLKNYLDGIRPEQISSILSLWNKLRLPGFITRIAIPKLLSARMKSDKWEAKLRSIEFNVKNEIRLRFFKKLLKTIDRISFSKRASHWTEYYDATEQEGLLRKKEIFSALLDEVQPKSVLDIGCNTGEFSIIAAKFGSAVIAFDNDTASVSELYNKADQQQLNILPLNMDILVPSPGCGWCGKQFAPASERLKADLVCMFAVIHHLVFTRGQDFSRVIQAVKQFQKKHALIEFVDKEDSMAVRLRRRIDFNDEWYTFENFLAELDKNYSEIRVLGSITATRHLVLCTL